MMAGDAGADVVVGKSGLGGSGVSAPEVVVDGGAEVPGMGATVVEGGEDDMIEREQADTKLVESSTLPDLGWRL
jgi:hypothetical protein